jgi:hypothetical protein
VTWPAIISASKVKIKAMQFSITSIFPDDAIRKRPQKSDEILEYVEPGKCMPSWVKDPIEFWQAADTFERANAKVYMEYEIALPNEFTPEQRKTLIETFLDKHIVPQQYPHSYAIHNVKSRSVAKISLIVTSCSR